MTTPLYRLQCSDWDTQLDEGSDYIMYVYSDDIQKFIEDYLSDSWSCASDVRDFVDSHERIDALPPDTPEWQVKTHA